MKAGAAGYWFHLRICMLRVGSSATYATATEGGGEWSGKRKTENDGPRLFRKHGISV